ncbi:MAG: C69 family dipeptidase [Bacteroidales bacterium]|nr:C69 family dipeptidase [Bacteroidales bacterium]
MKKTITFLLGILPFLCLAQIDKSDWIGGFPDGCTSITVGKAASFDGSVMTSHTDDSHRTRSEMNIVPAKDHPDGSVCKMYKRVSTDTFAMPAYANIEIGSIPQVAHTYQFINTAYPCMNEHQVGIGESTFGGREELQSDSGLIDCQRLCQLMLERCKTAQEAILMADDLTKKYGWNDVGECLTISDKKEVWHFEIVGPGKGKTGAIWVAQRVPDDHVAVNANASTIKEINLKDKNNFLASNNIFEAAKANAWWDESKGTFQWCYAYAPESRASIASRRREWRVFDLVAPSLKLDPNQENYPFSVKPDSAISLEKMVQLFADYYEGTPYDMRHTIRTTDDKGNSIISPLANPFMPYDQLELHGVRGSWYSMHKDGSFSFLGERTIARWYTMYGTILQSRDWMPDHVGGVAWLALDNIATSIYIPVYCSAAYLPTSYETPGRTKGFTRESAWWAFNYMGTLTAQRWGDMSKDVQAVWGPMQEEVFLNQKKIERDIYNIKSTKGQIEMLTRYTNEWGNKVVNRAWELGDYLFTKYDEKF